MDEYEKEILWVVLFQSIMNILLITDMFGFFKLESLWLKLIVLILWNISCSLCTGGMFLQKRKKEKNG